MSITNITFLEEFIPNGIFHISGPYILIFFDFDILELKKFLIKLEDDKIYVVTLDFVVSWMMYDEDTPSMILSKPILITKNSNPRVMSDFIMNKLNSAVDTYYLDDSIMQKVGSEGPGIILRYKEINIF
jgi:hypothetical protein